MATPPGPRGLATLGFLGGGSTSGLLRFIEETARTYGPVAGFRILGVPIVIVSDPELIGEILVRRQHEFERDTGATLLRELVGRGMLTSEEPRHRERRRMLQPAFHRAQIAAYAHTMAHEAQATAAAWSTRDVIDIGAEMRRLTLAVVGSALFGADMHASADRVAAVLARVTRRSVLLGPLTSFIEPLLRAYRRLAPDGPSLFFARERRELEAIVAPIVARRRAGEGRDIVSLLLAERDDHGAPLTDDDLRDEVVTLVLAGHETTATALAWAFFLLANHPDAATTLEAELDAVLGDRPPTLADAARLPYTTAVFNEALRLYPPALAFGRRPKADCELGAFTIRRGTSIFLSPYVVQRDERWFPEPLAFRPERWAGPAPPKFAYFPFGGGAKMCIGESFSRLEGVLVLATIAQRLRLTLVEPAGVTIGNGPTMRPDRPIRMRPNVRYPAGAIAT